MSKAFDLSVCDHLLPILSSRSRDDQPMVGVAMDLQEEKEHSTLVRDGDQVQRMCFDLLIGLFEKGKCGVQSQASDY